MPHPTSAPAIPARAAPPAALSRAVPRVPMAGTGPTAGITPARMPAGPAGRGGSLHDLCRGTRPAGTGFAAGSLPPTPVGRPNMAEEKLQGLKVAILVTDGF